MPPAARMTDPTTHPGMIAKGLPTVLIGKLPAARVGDQHICAFPPPAGPHPTNAVLKGSLTVNIGGMPAARANDACACGATILGGAPTVIIGG